MVLTAGKLILIDMLVEQIFTINERIAKIKNMNDEEVNQALVDENERSQRLKDLLNAD